MISCAYCGGEHEDVRQLWNCGDATGSAMVARGETYGPSQYNHWLDYVCPGCKSQLKADKSCDRWTMGVNADIIAGHIRNCPKYKLLYLAGGTARKR